MEFGSSQVKGVPDASDEVKIEDETAGDLQPLGRVERTSSVRASLLGHGSVVPPFVEVEAGLEESIEVDEEGDVDESAAAAAAAAVAVGAAGVAVGVAAAAATVEGEENTTPHWHDDEPKQPSRPQVMVDEALPTGGINSPGAAAAKAQGSSYPSDDQCCAFRCCGWPNGCFPIFFAQVFVFCGIILSSWSMVDCKFIIATAGFPETETPGENWPPPDQRRGFGFLFNETEQGGCGFTDEGRYFDDDELEVYFDFLGSDWDIPRYLSGAAEVIGWILLAFIVSFQCVSYVRSIRWLVAATLILIVGGLQSASFAVIGSSFCSDEANCEPSRGLWVAVAGIACYFVAAIMCCMMKDFPGAFA
jgi:hypothetical protein